MIRFAAIALILTLAACSSGGFGVSKDRVYAPDIDARGTAEPGLVVGHRLMAAGQPELALAAFRRAGAEEGLTPEVLSALGTANIGLGRLNQAEALFRRALKEEAEWPELWNNLGVVLMERGKISEAAEAFRRAYALDNGESDAIRDNLRLALEKIDNSGYADLDQDYKLVRRGSSDYLIRTTG
ncbi:tetratricopeptide repeat protein [Pseudaestuariivita atlantica]|uniref:Uncharacterized protein n=1 Tax=Pseudaestuariivita atlantica TaxID=1317121 RepID=A0A0L1JSW7_9RHOB|nr:tetratricopeptide repeat protein [Pseudaestuariivita atlantica]KNG94802.1 hypothetical protein ATO11_05285 [Pseudaestuariivita atlantica]